MDAAKAHFDSLSILFPAKEQQFEALKKQLAEKEQEVEKYISAGGNLGAARNEIASLHLANQSLQSELKYERNRTAGSQYRITELTNQLQNISEELAMTRERLAYYDNKIDENTTGDPNTPPGDAPLTISSVMVKANEISREDPTKKREAKSAAKTHELQICWVVEQTEGVGPSTQGFHIQIVDPTQTTIGTATAVDKSSGNSYKYTVEESMNYDGATAQVCTYFRSSDFSKGTYEVNIWNRGMKVGTGSVTLKK